MQATKDTFYVALRDRLAAYDPQRTVLLNGAERPAIVVAENEDPAAIAPLEGVFCLRWGQAVAVQPAISTLRAMECTISYRTSGANPNDEFDRGRILGALDSDLLAICAPAQTAKGDYSSEPQIPLGSLIFWTPPILNVAKELARQCVGRDAEVTVFFFPEVNQP